MPAIRLASSNLPLTGKLLWSLSLRKLMTLARLFG